MNLDLYDKFLMLQGENVGSVRKRIREKLGIPDKEFDKVRVNLFRLRFRY